MTLTLKEILLSDDPQKILPVFEFDLAKHSTPVIVGKFNLWARFFFQKYFKEKDAPFHREKMDFNNIRAYRGELASYTNIGFRGCAKTSRLKLFLAFVILNDKTDNGTPYRKYIKILSKDYTNAKQITTDTYNMFVDHKVARYYPSTFEKTDAKREETMDVYTTATGVKMLADTVGTDQRGQAQEAARPDFVVFEDFETTKTLRSAVESNAIWGNMKEARDGLSLGGTAIYNCNYLSERGNVHKLVLAKNEKNEVTITAILDEQGLPAWNAYTPELIEEIKQRPDVDFEGEYMCNPSASHDVIFDREKLKLQIPEKPIRTIGGVRYYAAYDPTHRYAVAADVSGGVGLDSSTAIAIDFETIPNRVVAAYDSNTVKPDAFAYVLTDIADYFGGCLIAPEKNNHGHATIAILKTIDNVQILKTPAPDTKNEQQAQRIETTSAEYGWHTNAITKPKMVNGLKRAVEDGHLLLVDEKLITETKGYTRNDLMDREVDARLSTRHFDLFTAACICVQMNEYSLEIAPAKYDESLLPPEEDPMYPDIGL